MERESSQKSGEQHPLLGACALRLALSAYTFGLETNKSSFIT